MAVYATIANAFFPASAKHPYADDQAPCGQGRLAFDPCGSDRAYHGMNFTQFFGAFNDNLFKQLVLLICVDYFHETGHDYQGKAQLLFALPFVLFSGFAGFLSDRISKAADRRSR